MDSVPIKAVLRRYAIAFVSFFALGYIASQASVNFEHAQRTAALEAQEKLDTNLATTSTLVCECSGDGSLPDDCGSSACYSEDKDEILFEFTLWEDIAIPSDTANDDFDEVRAEVYNRIRDGEVGVVSAVLGLDETPVNGGTPAGGKDAQKTDGSTSSFLKKTKRGFHDSNLMFVDGEGGRRKLAKGSGSSSENLHITLSNKYRTGNSMDRYSYEYLVEPYTPTNIKLKNPTTGASYRWTLEGHVQGYGTEVDINIASLGQFALVVEEMTSSDGEEGALERTNTFTLTSKYVRREMRQLTDKDRETWLNAMMVMQRTPTMVGQRVYGSNYFSKDHFVRMHIYYGGTVDCDHWHQGPGFVTSHVALTLMWEKALQAVDPTISAPYWDFTLESTFFSADNWQESAVFASDWFGEGSPDNGMHTPTKGRWAFVSTLIDTDGVYSSIRNSYGLMRAPWNNDPTPFMTRANYVYDLAQNLKPSGCTEYHNTNRAKTWSTLAIMLNSAAHGHIHETVGGSWNHYYQNLAADATDEAYDSIQGFSHSIQASSKLLWRSGFVTCPDSCSMETAVADCQCTCDASAMSGLSAREILDTAGVLAATSFFDSNFNSVAKDSWYDDQGVALSQLDGYTVEETAEIHKSLLETICNPGLIGDMFQASSPNDITFWVIHSTIDRLWHAIRLKARIDETWENTYTCYGHNPSDYQPFSNLFEDSSSSGFNMDKAIALYKNSELYEMFHPESPLLPYVYADFDWTHCDFLGISVGQ